MLPNQSELTIQQMQQQVDDYISQFVEGYFSPMELMVRMSEEAGELAREIMHVYGPKKKKAAEKDSSIAMELADCMFIITCLANSLGIDLAHAHQQMMHKFQTRDANRWTKKQQSE